MTDIVSAEVIAKRSICTIDLTEAFKTVNECIAPKFGDTLEFLMADVKDWYKFQSALSRYAENGNDIIYRVGVVERANDCRVKATKIIYEIAETLLEQAAAKIALNIDGCLAQIFGINLINLQIPTPCLRVEPRKAVLARLPKNTNVREQIEGGSLPNDPEVPKNIEKTQDQDSPLIFDATTPNAVTTGSSKVKVSNFGGTDNAKSQCETYSASEPRTADLFEGFSLDTGSGSNPAGVEPTSTGDLCYDINPTKEIIYSMGVYNAYFDAPFAWSRAFSKTKWAQTPDDELKNFTSKLVDYANQVLPTGDLIKAAFLKQAHESPEFKAFEESANKVLSNSKAFIDILDAESSSTLISYCNVAERNALKTLANDHTVTVRFLMRVARLAQLRLAPYGQTHKHDQKHGQECLEALSIERQSILTSEAEGTEFQRAKLLAYLNDTLTIWWDTLHLGKPLEQVVANDEAISA